MIKLSNKTNLDSLEQFYLKLSEVNSVDIMITKSFNTLDFGLTPAIIQFVSTWHSKCNDSKLLIDIDANADYESMDEERLAIYSEELLEDIYKLDYVFPIVVYCWNHPIEDSKQRNIKSLLKIQNEKKHIKMRKQSEGGGLKTFLSCFDQLGPKKGLIPAFYIDDEFIDNEMQFDFAIDKSIRQVISLNAELRKSNYIPVHSDIIAIIYELIKNTDDWAKTDIQNRPIKPNTRGLFMKTHRRKREAFVRGFSDHKGLKDFFSEENFATTTSDELHFLELSVFDTGVGFVNRYSKKPTTESSLKEQVDIVKKCLVINNTSATGLDKRSKGKGLARIMRILNNKGFFWLRTGNISVFRNLITNPHIENSGSDFIQLYDWNINSNSEFSKLSEAKGSVVTLVYPLINLVNV